MERKSEYFTGLSTASRLRYEQKVTASGLQIDPYTIKNWFDSPEVIPSVEWSDMMLYMTATPSQFTRESIKAWKGMLDGGSFMRAGWVHDIKLHPFTVSGDHGANRFIIMGKHSQRVSADFLLLWVVAKQDGEILAAHCTCMAGLGEACSHIAALLSCVINANEIRKRFGVDSCTSNLCAWNHPVKEVKPAYLADIKFYGQGSRKRCFGDSVNEQQCKTVCRGSPAPPATLQSSSSQSTSSSQSLSSQSTSSSQSLSSQQSTSSDQPSSSQSTSSSQSLSSQQSTSSDQSSSSQSASSDQPSSSQSTSSSQSLSSQQSTSSDQSSSSQSTSSSNRHPRLLQTPEEDQKDFFKKLNTAKTKPAILKIVDPYFEQFIPKTLQPSFPKLLGELYNLSTLTLKYPKLMEECEKVFNSYKVSVEQVRELEANTRDQSHSRLWFLHRVGCITASNFKAAVQTDPCMPSQSLIRIVE